MKCPQKVFLNLDKGSGDILVKWRKNQNFSYQLVRGWLQELKRGSTQLGLFLLIFLVGCVAGEGGKKSASCGSGQAFDSISRKCQGAIVLPGPPTGTLSSLSLLEDSGTNAVELRYSDADNDLASACSVSSSAPGIIKYLTTQGLRLKSEANIEDPHNTIISFSSGGALAVTPVTLVPSIREIQVVLGPASTSVSVANALNGNATIQTWVDASPIANQVMVADSTPRALTELECSCFGGKCQTVIEPVLNYFGTTEFNYSITDKDGTSSSRNVKLNITSVNDDPILTLFTPATFIAATELLDTASTSTYSASGNLLSNFILSVSDVEDTLSSSFSFQLVTPPIHGTATLDIFGNFTYRTTAHQVSDSFEVRVFDSSGGVSASVTVPITIATVNDPPVGTLTSISAINEEASSGVITLTYTDEESNNISKCVITSISKVYPDGGCSCAANVCTVTVRGIPGQNGTGSFGYKIYDDTSPNPPQETTASFTITSIADDPIVFPTVATTVSIQNLESDTFEPLSYNFVLDGAADDDGHSILSYTLSTAPVNGTISGCLGQGSSGLNCTYTPLDGNLADTTSLDATIPSLNMAQVATDTGTFYATTLGDSYDGLQIELVNIRNTDEAINTLFGANAMAYNDGNNVVILFQSSLTQGSDIVTAIAANSNVSKLVGFDPTIGVQTTTGTISLASGATTIDKFTFQALDSSGATSTKTVHVSIIPTNDRPTLCEYSSYADTTICGLNGCISDALPTNITPDVDGLTFYSKLSGACYNSSGGAWLPVESSIKDRSINELDPIVIDDIRIDEGGGASEDSETLTITNVDSSDENLIPLGNIEFFYGSSLTSIGKGNGAFPLAVGDGGTSADLNKMRLIIIPQTINPPVDEKTSTIEITVADSTGKSTEVTFVVTVKKVSATHGGWANFKATGPKVDSLGLVNEPRTVCPYSLDMCETGQKCLGTASPANNTAADPDHEDAIFMQETSGVVTCYRMKRNLFQNISYVGKTSNNVTIEYTDGATAGAANVSVSGNAITVQIEDDVTTTDTIISQIEGTAAAHALVKAINLKIGETQDTQTATAIAPLSNASWESFETYCNATPVALENGCDNSSRLSCIGKTSPIGVVTPSNKDSRFWDEQRNVCYRSTGATSADWETYDAPSEIELTWNQFSVNGSASVSEYRVFRRLANEEFDFSKPINRDTISGSTSTFTFTDNAANSVVPPSPGTVYYYVVRPVVNNILTSTAAETGTNANGLVRIMAPPKNMAFAHRWMINKRICSLMNRTSDSTNNYRCSYKGAGDITANGSQFYDYGKDLLVDRFEAGCAFSPAPNCPGTFDNSCVGVSNPTSAGITATANLMYYSRGEGKCYKAANDGSGWVEFESVTLSEYFTNVEPNTVNLVASNPQFDSNNDKLYHRASLPPLTNVTQLRANQFCTGLEDIDSTELLGIQTDISHRLPGRKDQVAYSQWDDDDFTDSQIATTETGLSLNSSSKCNSSGASGLEDGYVDFDKPDSNDFYSLPGTAASNIRSITTGSNETATCTSAFGVQDTVGNVAEWTTNGFHCPLLSQCFTSESIVIQGVEFIKKRPLTDAVGILINNAGGAPVSVASGGGISTITIDINSGTDTPDEVVAAVNGFAAASALVTARVVTDDGTTPMGPFGNTVFIGLEIPGTDDTDFISSDTTDDYGIWSLDGLRGPCVDSDSDEICDANISSWAIEDERFSAGRFMTPMGLPAEVSANSTYNTDYDLFEIGPTSGITSLKLHDDTVNFNSRVIASEPTTGCGGLSTGGSYVSGNGAGVWNLESHPCANGFGVLTIQDVTFKARSSAELLIDVRYVENADGDATVVTLVGNTLEIDLDDLGTKNASSVVIEVVNDGTLEAFVSGDPTALQVAFTNPVSFTDLQAEAVPSRVDVGFRCILDVTNAVYDE